MRIGKERKCNAERAAGNATTCAPPGPCSATHFCATFPRAATSGLRQEETRGLIPTRPAYVPLAQLATQTSPILGAVMFGTDVGLDTSRGFPLLALPMRQLQPEPLAEVWFATDRAHLSSREGIALAESNDLLFGALLLDGTELELVANDAYDRLIRVIRDCGFPHLLRMWNHVRDINADERELEVYRRFCAGRHEAFQAHGYEHRTDLPAASGVGMRDGRLAIYFLAGRAPATQVENPRQMSAYDYPKQYGPKSPSFSRATFLHDDAEALVFVSGTASIVGHESLHVGDRDAQLEETLRNIDVVIASAAERSGFHGSLADVITAKTYIRHPSDYASIAARLDTAFPHASKLYVESDICRAELLLEIEAVARLKR
jgi:enamine deaminase RidA (YjgF/YER057c/UK114 family)